MNRNDNETMACQCEHMDHFGSDDVEAAEQHDYGKQFPINEIHTVKTSFGTYDLCRKCIRECLHMTGEN